MNKRIRKKQLKKIGAYVPSRDTWNLDITIAEFILPRLKLFKEVADCFPAKLDSMEEWHDILDKMIDAFYLISTDKRKTEADNNAIEEGLGLFKRYYHSLWW